jgi:ribonucleotide monophosphatase NagD (HAD superfamily)
VGETRSYDYEKIERAVRLILKGARFIANNPDLTGPTELGITPACGALVAPIELATGKKPYFVGKPNPRMMWTALAALQTGSRMWGISRRQSWDRDRLSAMVAPVESWRLRVACIASA